MKQIMITLKLSKENPPIISFSDSLLENGNSLFGEIPLENWEEFKNVTLKDVMDLYRTLDGLRQTPCCGMTTVENHLKQAIASKEASIIHRLTRFITEGISQK